MYLLDLEQYNRGRERLDLSPLIASVNKRIVDFFTKGKEYFFILAEGRGIRAHHLMHGHWTFDQPENMNNTHYRLDFSPELDNQSPSKISLYFVNTRFGEFNIYSSPEQLIHAVNRLAPGFIGRFILSKQEWLDGLAKMKQTNILWKVVTDQKRLCSGIGNYLRAELFYYSGLHYLTRVGQISVEERAHIYDVFTYVINGHYRKTLQKVIYKHKFSPNGNPIVSENVKGWQKVWYCPAEQPMRP
jgi:formamidopyrimidine-DNA glycosylase